MAITDEELDELEAWLQANAEARPCEPVVNDGWDALAELVFRVVATLWNAVCWVARFLSQEIDFSPAASGGKVGGYSAYGEKPANIQSPPTAGGTAPRHHDRNDRR